MLAVRYSEDSRPGRRSVPPGVYFRMLFVGYVEGIDSQRGPDRQREDGLTLHEFLGVPLTSARASESTIRAGAERFRR